jgi:hypothetical protein
LENGEFKTRSNIIDEYRLAQQKEHLSHKLLVFKAKDVELHSNINPVYERLPLDDPDWIANKIVDHARIWGLLPPSDPPAADSEPTSSGEGTSTTPSVVLTGDDDATASQQAIDALTSATAALSGETKDRPALLRAELAIAGLNADESDADALGVHLANNLFAQRDQIRLRRQERLLLFGTYLRHAQNDNVPGIFWIRDLSRPQLIEVLLSLLGDSRDPVAQRQALHLLGKLGAPTAAEKARDLLDPLLRADDAALRQGALDFIRERHDLRLRDLLEDSELLERDRHWVSQTAAMLDVRQKPSDVMARYINDEYVRSPEIETALLRVARRVRRELVLAALENPARNLRRTGLRMANEKGLLTASLARKIIASDDSAQVRLAAIRCLLDAGEPVDFDLYRLAASQRDGEAPDLTSFLKQRTLELETAERVPLDDLRAGIRWIAGNGPSCYEALGLRDTNWAERNVRRDLRTGFVGLRDGERVSIRTSVLADFETSLRRPLTEQEQSEARNKVDELWKPWSPDEKVGQFTMRLYTRAALRILVANGRPADVHIARQFANSGDQDLRGEALRLFERFGTPHDAATVATLTAQIYDAELQLRGAETALRLAYKKDKLGILKALREVHSLREWSVEQLAGIPDGVNEAWWLLWSKDADIRVAAADVVWDAVDPQHADRLLSLYTGDRHFYNVVRAIDCRLYAPDWLADALSGSS